MYIIKPCDRKNNNCSSEQSDKSERSNKIMIAVRTSKFRIYYGILAPNP
jgi:hypothetical protein